MGVKLKRLDRAHVQAAQDPIELAHLVQVQLREGGEGLPHPSRSPFHRSVLLSPSSDVSHYPFLLFLVKEALPQCAHFLFLGCPRIPLRQSFMSICILRGVRGQVEQALAGVGHGSGSGSGGEAAVASEVVSPPRAAVEDPSAGVAQDGDPLIHQLHRGDGWVQTDA